MLHMHHYYIDKLNLFVCNRKLILPATTMNNAVNIIVINTYNTSLINAVIQVKNKNVVIAKRICLICCYIVFILFYICL